MGRRIPGRRMALVNPVVAALVAGCAGPSDHTGGEAPRLVGESAQYTLLEPARIARPTPFRTADGETVDLRRFRGKVVLLNFWATWCAPCVVEMPSLDDLAAAMGGDEFAVVPVSIDEGGSAAVSRFYRSHGLDHLDMYLDPGQRTAYRDADNPNDAEFPLYGLPISYIVDHEGQVMGYITGAVDWRSMPARALIRHYTARIGG